MVVNIKPDSFSENLCLTPQLLREPYSTDRSTMIKRSWAPPWAHLLQVQVTTGEKMDHQPHKPTETAHCLLQYTAQPPSELKTSDICSECQEQRKEVRQVSNAVNHPYGPHNSKQRPQAQLL